MLKEAFKYLVGLADKPDTVKLDDCFTRSRKDLLIIQTPMDETLVVHTLSGFKDAIGQRINGFKPEEVVVVVNDYSTVSLIGKECDEFGRRAEYVIAKAPDAADFRFGQYMACEDFIIEVQRGFCLDGGLNYIISLASNLTSEHVEDHTDNGLSQTAVVRKGATSKAQVAIEPRQFLRPYRTFRDAEQPKTEFLFRLRQAKDGEKPQLALFEVDGKNWKLDAVKNIRAEIANKIGDIKVIA
jgi:hypothetical protein